MNLSIIQVLLIYISRKVIELHTYCAVHKNSYECARVHARTQNWCSELENDSEVKTKVVFSEYTIQKCCKGTF